MIPFLTDEDFNGRIVRGLFLQRNDLDLVRVQDVGLLSADDASILKWAEEHKRVLLTHDARTMPKHVREHVNSGAHVTGVFIVDDDAPIGVCIDHILLINDCSELSEWLDQIRYVPFK